jgi:hypothetical protein
MIEVGTASDLSSVERSLYVWPAVMLTWRSVCCTASENSGKDQVMQDFQQGIIQVWSVRR